jgi:hypothetical protein
LCYGYPDKSSRELYQEIRKQSFRLRFIEVKFNIRELLKFSGNLSEKEIDHIVSSEKTI